MGSVASNNSPETCDICTSSRTYISKSAVTLEMQVAAMSLGTFGNFMLTDSGAGLLDAEDGETQYAWTDSAMIERET